MVVAPAAAQSGDDAFRFAQRQSLATTELIGSAGVGIAGRGDLGDLFRNPAGLGWMDRGAFSISLNSSSVQNDGIYSAGAGASSAESITLSDTRLGGATYAYKVPTALGSMVIAGGISQTASFERSLAFNGENGFNSLTDFLMPLSNEFELVEENGEVFPEFSRPLSFIGFETFAIDLDGDAVAAGDPVPFYPAVSAGTVAQTGLVEEEGRQSSFNIGAGFEASKDVMVGFSMNIPFGTYRYTRRLEEEDIFNDNDGTGGTADFAYLDFSEGFESRMVGLNFRGGVSAQVSENIRVGLSIETPTWYSVSEDYDTALYTEFDNGDAFEYGDDFEEDAGRGSFDYNVQSPWRMEAGIAFQTGGFTLSGDLEFVDWSQLELDSDTYAFSDENLAIRQAFESTMNVRIGAGYRFDNLELRGGLAVNPDPRQNAEINRDRGTVGLGLSYFVNDQFAFDFGVMAEVFEDSYQPYREVANAPVVSEEVARSFFSIGVRVGL
jgi:long-subunit fatty acid transport protein